VEGEVKERRMVGGWWPCGDGEGKDLDQGHSWFNASDYFSSFPISIERRLVCVGVCVW
jgi:hypothetical protein